MKSRIMRELMEEAMTSRKTERPKLGTVIEIRYGVHPRRVSVPKAEETITMNIAQDAEGVNDNRRVRILRVSPAVLLGALRLPPGTRLLDVRIEGFVEGIVELKIAHPDFQPMFPGMVIPRIGARYISRPAVGGETVAEFAGWELS